MPPPNSIVKKISIVKNRTPGIVLLFKVYAAMAVRNTLASVPTTVRKIEMPNAESILAEVSTSVKF
ncbi:hypothetical protein D3C73_1667370 [compost metagenome]